MPTKTGASAASRIQSTQAKASNPTGKGSFPSRVQSAAATNANKAAGAGAGASEGAPKPAGGAKKGSKK